MATPASAGWRCSGSSRPTSRPASTSIRPAASCPTTSAWSSSTPRAWTPSRAGSCCSTTGPASSCCGCPWWRWGRAGPGSGRGGGGADALRHAAVRRHPDRPGSVGRPAHADRARSLTVDEFLWVVYPYICLTVFVVGHFWRYRYDKFGWTTRSSQLYEDRLLRIGSPLFHFGII